MAKETYQFEYESYASSDDLPEADRQLLEEAREVTKKAYAPYSRFHVGAVALLKNGQKVTGTNQENASYPVGICAERVLLASASMLNTGEPIHTIAISYHNLNGESNKPVSPCGMCRQSLAEYEERVGHPIRLVLSGMEGTVLVVSRATQLLPFSFKGEDLKG